MRKLKVQELENRIAPSYGLFSFLSGLASQDAEFGEIFNAVVDQDTGEVDVEDRTADALMSIFGR